MADSSVSIQPPSTLLGSIIEAPSVVEVSAPPGYLLNHTRIEGINGCEPHHAQPSTHLAHASVMTHMEGTDIYCEKTQVPVKRNAMFN